MMLKSSAAVRSVGRKAAMAAPQRLAAAIRRPAVVVKAQSEEPRVFSNDDLQQVPSTSTSASEAAVATADFKLLNATTEALNGRSAMLGFVFAMLAESTTHQSVWSQIAGKYSALGEFVEKPLGLASIGFGAVVAVVTMATLAPKLIEGLNVDSKSFGPFTPALESLIGRVAMMGFLGLVLVELVKGSSLL